MAGEMSSVNWSLERKQ